MNKKSLAAWLLLLLCLPVMQVFAKGSTPVETFIRHIKEANTFVPVSNLWTPDLAFDKKPLLEKIEKAQPLIIDYAAIAEFVKQKNTAISLEIPGINGGTYTLELARYDFLSNDFQVHTLGANNEDKLFDYTPGVYYMGVVKGIPGSVATFSFFKNEVYGVFTLPGEPGNFTIVPNTMVGNYYDYNQHYVLYNDADVKDKTFAPSCDADKLPVAKEDPASKTTTYYNNNVYNSCTEVRVFEVGDYALYQTKGSSAVTVTNFITALFNHQATLYRNEGIPIVLKYVQVNTVTDNYQHITTANSSLFLDTFGKVTQNTLHGCDLALLVSTALNGGYGALGGVAWLRALCATYSPSSFFGPYGFCNMDNSGISATLPVFSWDIEVIVHEMGHIVGSPHTHACCWNPPARNTAIDGCYTIEGSCPDPGDPTTAVGGTIMSYCHLTSTGIKFTNGFGPQPGDTIRRYINSKFSATCGAVFRDSVAFYKPSKKVKANRECTDATGTTYYWQDNNTADHTDDSLVLMIKKNGNNIGNLDSVGFSVTDSTLALNGGGRADTAAFPSGIPGVLSKNMVMRRYWRIVPTKDPSTAVEVIFPFTDKDTADIEGSVPGTAPMSSLLMYKINDTAINPNPAANFPGATAANFSIYTYGSTATTTNWSLTSIGYTKFAHMMMTNLKGSGSGFYTYGSVSVDEVNNTSGIQIYPNPTHDQWYIAIDRKTSESLTMQLYAADGRMVHAQQLQDGTVNTVTAADMPPGVYFYRIVSGSNVYTGNLVKK